MKNTKKTIFKQKIQNYDNKSKNNRRKARGIRMRNSEYNRQRRISVQNGRRQGTWLGNTRRERPRVHRTARIQPLDHIHERINIS